MNGGEELLAVGQVMLAAGRLRRERRLDSLRVRHLQGAVDFVGGDVVETLAFILLRETLPIRLGSLQHGQGTDDVGLREGERVLDGPVHMGLRREMDHAVHMFILHEGQDALEVADVHLDEPVVGPVLDVLEVREIARVGKLVQVDDPVVRVFVHEQPHDVAADETSAAGDEDGSIAHIGKDDVCLFRKG